MSHAELLGQLAFDGAIEPFLVLADALQREADPWGQLIAFACRGARAEHDALLAEHGRVLCALHGAPGRHVEWDRGFVRAVTFTGDVAVDLETELVPLLDAPVGALVERVCCEDAHLDDRHADALLRHAGRLARVIELELGRNWFSHDAVHELRAAFPRATLGFQRRTIATSEGGTYRGLVKSWNGR